MKRKVNRILTPLALLGRGDKASVLFDCGHFDKLTRTELRRKKHHCFDCINGKPLDLLALSIIEDAELLLCGKCGLAKPVDAFPVYRDRSGEHRASRCIKCTGVQRLVGAPKFRGSYYQQFEAKRRAYIRGSQVQLFTLEDIIRRDGPACYLCKVDPAINPTLEHVIPLSRGGSHNPLNCRVACHSCNSRKGQKLLSEL